MKVLWLSAIFPEPYSSAAGVRTTELVRLLLTLNHEVHFWSTSEVPEARAQIEQYGVQTALTEVNSSKFDRYLVQLQPDLVVFDRFMIEEQFGWRVRSACPNAVRILDTIDLHFLRKAREQTVRSSFSEHDASTPWPIPVSSITEDALREVSAILRSDVSLLVSDEEKRVLVDQYRIHESLLASLPISVNPIHEVPQFGERKDFVFIGNVNHPPNYDAIKVLVSNVWPLIHRAVNKLGSSPPELHIYGSYPKQDVIALSKGKNSIFYKGQSPNAQETIKSYRVNLAPLRFGAGVKGKVLDGWAVGTPCVATSVAAEGLTYEGQFGGSISNDWEAYAANAANLYCDPVKWHELSSLSTDLINNYHSTDVVRQNTETIFSTVIQNVKTVREQNFIGAMLWHHSHKSTEYMSRWIEEKNKNAVIAKQTE